MSTIPPQPIRTIGDPALDVRLPYLPMGMRLLVWNPKSTDWSLADCRYASCSDLLDALVGLDPAVFDELLLRALDKTINNRQEAK